MASASALSLRDNSGKHAGAKECPGLMRLYIFRQISWLISTRDWVQVKNRMFVRADFSTEGFKM